MNKWFIVFAVLFIAGFFFINYPTTVTGFFSFNNYDTLEQKGNVFSGLLFHWLALLLVMVVFVVYVFKLQFDAGFHSSNVHKKLNDIHNLIKQNKFSDAFNIYYNLQPEIKKVHRSNSALKYRIFKLNNEVALYLKANHSYELAKGSKFGLVKAMEETFNLAQRAAQQMPEDINLYKQAKKQYDYCRNVVNRGK
ncbi:MAG: hypothetical protein HYS32_02335 [Candidatus Woesearchaeota archaeon]|nr:MAG: hypothetical protein HYS32_02335 [Candidatus Woesearchaeota archaeon]